MLELHRKYILNRINMIIIGTIVFVITLILLFSIKIGWSTEVRWLNRDTCINNYLQNMVFTTKLIGIIFSCYLMGNAFNRYSDGYAVLFLRQQKERIKYYFCKLMALFLVNSLVIMLFMIIGTFILYLMGNWFNDYLMILRIGFNLLTITTIYGLLSIIISLILKSNFSFIVPFVLFLGMEVLADMIGETTIYNSLKIFFPTFNFYSENRLIGENLLLIIAYSQLGGIIYYEKNN